MHLPQRSGRDRFAVQLAEDLIHRSPEVFLDAGHGQGAVKTRQLVLQLGQFFQQDRRHDVGPGGEGLAGFDEGGSEFGQQFGAFSLLELQGAAGPVEPDAQQIETNRHQGLPQPPDQPLGMAGVDAGDGGRVIAQQSSRFDEVAQVARGWRCGAMLRARFMQGGVQVARAALRGWGRADHGGGVPCHAGADGANRNVPPF